MFRQPLWWWLGKSFWAEDEIELFGLTPREARHDPWRERPGRVWRRFKGIRPRPISVALTRYRRGRDGWAISDTWGLHSYLAGWLPDALDHIREHAHGYPMGLCEHMSQGPGGVACLTGECSGGCDGPALWDEALRKMADGFRAAAQIDGLDYYVTGDSREANKAREEALKAEFDEGMALFAKWWFALWD